MAVLVLAAVALVAGACGGGGDGDGGSASGDGEERTVLVDYHHDEFASAFLQYYPRNVQVRPGDTVHFKQAWSGEPHSVTMGKVVDDMMKLAPLVMEYDSAEEARADGVPEDTIQRVEDAFGKLPGMTGDGFTIYQPGARPCYVDDIEDLPEFIDLETEEINDEAKCPTDGDPQPAFDGKQALYNSGFIPPTGESANRFDLPIAADAEPGTYQYFCNFHWIGMSGTVEIVEPGEKIPSQAEVNAQARKELTDTSKSALTRVRAARKGDFGGLTPPLAGRSPVDDTESEEPEAYVVVNEFLPKTIKAKVNKPVTWTLDGFGHTVSFNVPKYFPVFTVAKNGNVEWNPKSYEAVGWDIPEPEGHGPPEEEEQAAGASTEAAEADPAEEPSADEEEEEGPFIDVGKWDGKGGFHSSGMLDAGSTFTLTFTKAGTYPYACVLHPQMVGTVEVSA